MEKLTVSDTILNFSGSAAVVLGGAYVNALHVIRGLGNEVPILAINNDLDPGLYSKYVNQRFIIKELNIKSIFLNTLLTIGRQLNYKAVIFPTSDVHVKLLSELHNELSEHYIIPINPSTVLSLISKESQYNLCSEIGIPFPKSLFLKTERDVYCLGENVNEMLFPLIIKPLNSIEGIDIFKVKIIHSKDDLMSSIQLLRDKISVGFVVSEFIPGEPDNIWIYIGYCDRESKVLAGWTARKLTQRPYYLGVFSTARYEYNSEVASQGKKLLESGKYIGIGEPEFKYDYRDKKYKLMEINPRYMMFHGVGIKGGINLPLVQYFYCIGDKKKLEENIKCQNNNRAHLVFMYFEILNIIDHKPRIKYFKNALIALFRSNKMWGVLDFKDMYPMLIFFKMIIIFFREGIFWEKIKKHNY